MIDIYPVPKKAIGDVLSSVVHLGTWESQSVPEKDRPFLQIGYEEIEQRELKRIFAYENIIGVNRPIGVPRKMRALFIPDDTIIFSLFDFTEHLKETAPEISKDYAESRTMNAYVQLKGDGLSAQEYLVAGLLECVRFCQQTDWLLEIRW